MRRSMALSALALALATGGLWAHDFWIVPDAFQVAAGAELAVRGQTSVKFPTSESAVLPDRVAEARLVGASGEERLTDLTTDGKSLLIRHRPTTPGQRIVAVALISRSTRTTPERLKRYIALEGAPALAERYERESAYPKSDSVTQVSVKFAKTIVEIGSNGPRAFDRAVGHALELVPLSDPSALHRGDTLVVRLVYRGRPVPGALLRAGAAATGVTATSDSARMAAPAPAEVSAETDAEGVARIPVANGGLWNVRTLFAAPVPAAATGSGSTWEVGFVTLVFYIRED